MGPPENQWPATDGARNALFVAQSMREMLDQTSFESFRIPTLNLLSRTLEVLQLAEQAQVAKIPTAAIEPAIEELKWALDNDPIGKQIIPVEAEQFPLSIKGLSLGNPADLQRLHRLTEVVFERLLPEYKSTLQSEIVHNYNSDRKDYVRKLLHNYFSLLVLEGWDVNFLRRTVDEKFFSSDIRKVEKRTFESFFNKFDFKTRTFLVYVETNADTYQYFQKLKFPLVEALNRQRIPTNIRRKFDQRNGGNPINHLLKCTIERLDANGTTNQAYEMLNLLASLTTIQKFSVNLTWFDFAYAVSHRGVKGTFETFSEVQFQGVGKSTGRATGKKQKRQAGIVLRKMAKSSSSRTLQALANVSLAQRSTNPENQLGPVDKLDSQSLRDVIQDSFCGGYLGAVADGGCRVGIL